MYSRLRQAAVVLIAVAVFLGVAETSGGCGNDPDSVFDASTDESAQSDATTPPPFSTGGDGGGSRDGSSDDGTSDAPDASADGASDGGVTPDDGGTDGAAADSGTDGGDAPVTNPENPDAPTDGDATIQSVEMGQERPSKHEKHAVDAQLQFALLVIIVLSALYIVFARIDDWWKYRR